MRKSVLVDTNVLLDAAMRERPDHAYALMLFDEAVYEGLDLRVCVSSYKDVYYVLTKYASEPEARAYVADLLRVTTPSPVDSACLEIAVTSNEPDFEDAVVRACAERDGSTPSSRGTRARSATAACGA